MFFKKIINSIFGNSDDETGSDHSAIKFGRYTDSYKSLEKYDSWNRAIELFEQGNYLQSYLEFFNYLLDDDIGNVVYSLEDDRVTFEIYQGSKVVKGYADQHEISGEVRVAYVKALNVALGRKLLAINYTLHYSCFSLHDDIVYIRFNTDAVDGFPGKLYNGLREIAVYADQQDDQLIEEFTGVEPIDDAHVVHLSEEEKQIKYNFIQKWIKEAFEKTSKLNPEKYAGPISYLLLNALYRIDYLVTPEGTLMILLEKMQNDYFKQKDKTHLERNNILIKEFKKVLERTPEEIGNTLYTVKSTFGLSKPVSHEEVAEYIERQLRSLNWYMENDHQFLVTDIVEYVSGYCLFNYALPRPTRELLHLYVQMVNPEFFAAMGIQSSYYNPQTDTLNRQAILARISYIIREGKEDAPMLNIDPAKLNFNSLVYFAVSFLQEVKSLNYRKQ